MVEKTLNIAETISIEQTDLYQEISRDAGKIVSKFVAENISLQNEKSILYLPEKGKHDHDVDYSNIHSIVDFRKINHFYEVNRHFISINKLLPDAGVYIGSFESYYNRKVRFFRTFGKTFGMIIWFFDLIFNRALPKLELTKGFYKLITRNRYKVISVAETLGRSVYCGFEVIDFKIVNNVTYFAVIKTSNPKNDGDPSYGPFFKMKRVGKNGKMIGVYKLRTMHPYSEYLQNFVVKLNGYDEAGKPKNDFRVTGWGRTFRKVWLDELPQVLNVLKGELGIVGVRPLSQFRFSQLPEDVKKQRVRFKPGCIPPYVALNMPDAEGNIEAERIYIKDMRKNRYLTPIRYFFKGVFNILSRRIQSA
jgi:lipopolysaccharide/colanic/teichoic acid biosynthesis glycosyltransferase